MVNSFYWIKHWKVAWKNS